LTEEPLIEALRARGIRTVSLTTLLKDRLAGRSLCELLIEPQACNGHFNPEGNRIVAELMVRYLRDEGLVAAQHGR
jgi:hypothetical protein